MDFPVDQWVSTKPGLTKHTWWDDPPMFSSYKHHEDFNELMIEKPRTWPSFFLKKILLMMVNYMVIIWLI